MSQIIFPKLFFFFFFKRDPFASGLFKNTFMNLSNLNYLTQTYKIYSTKQLLMVLSLQTFNLSLKSFIKKVILSYSPTLSLYLGHDCHFLPTLAFHSFHSFFNFKACLLRRCTVVRKLYANFVIVLLLLRSSVEKTHSPLQKSQL